METSIYKDISIEYWSKIKKKKKLLNYFDTNTTHMYKKNNISSMAGNVKYTNFQNNREQIVIICSNKD